MSHSIKIGALFASLLWTSVTLAAGPAADPSETVIVGAGYLDPVLPLTDATRRALASGDHESALRGLNDLTNQNLHGHHLDDRAFLLAWTHLALGNEDAAVALLPAVRQADHIPAAWHDLVLGKLLVASDQQVDAAAAFARIEPTSTLWPEAQLRLADARSEAGATAEALEIWERLVARADPAEGSATALWALAEKKGLGSTASYAYLRRLWAHYPATREAGRASTALARYESRSREFRPRDAEIAARADTLMSSWGYKQILTEMSPITARFVTPDNNYCTFWYAIGRSNFKRNQVTKAAEVLQRMADKCATIDPDRSARALYIAGKSLERKKAWSAAAAAYRAIPERFPDHSMADDGFALAGIALQNIGQDDSAIALWERQVAAYPKGDLAAEGFWRLAWSAYRSGHPDDAIRWAERGVWEVPITSDPVHVSAMRYWAARWRIHPRVAAPNELHEDPKSVQAGIDGLIALCRDQPSSFYALLAAQRLYSLAPKRLAALTRPDVSASPPGLEVRVNFMVDPANAAALSLARLGLIREARRELDASALEDDTPGEEALRAEIVALSDPIAAHDRLHHYLLHHPPETLGRDRSAILTAAYPNLYWDEVQQATEAFSWDPRVFHALVREESSFNANNVSWAGAQGLCQLMPATAKRVGAWLNIKVTKTSMVEPLTNLRIGSRYIEYLRDYFGDNMFLAVPAYNAGEGNVGKWRRGLGPVPTDEFVESIPIRETRHYVKRVLGTYQLYRLLYDEGPLFPDWSHTVNSIGGG